MESIPILEEEDKCGICFEPLKGRYAIITEESHERYHIECLNEWHKRTGNRGLIKDKITTIEIFQDNNLIESRYVVEKQPVVIQHHHVVNNKWKKRCHTIIIMCFSTLLVTFILFFVGRILE